MKMDGFVESLLRRAKQGGVTCTVHSDKWSSYMHCLGNIQERLQGRIGPVAGIRILRSGSAPDVIRAAEDQQFAIVDHTWLKHIKVETQATVPCTEEVNTRHVWVVIAPKSPEPEVHFDVVPVRFWHTLWDRFYRYIPGDLVNPDGLGYIYPHAIVGDPFYLDSISHKDDLWCGTKMNGFPMGYVPEHVHVRNESIKGIEIKGFAEDLRGEKYGINDPCVAYARGILVKKFFGSQSRRTARVEIQNLEIGKGADMLLVEIYKSTSDRGYYWCKFGSPAKLYAEHLRATRLRRYRPLKPFLYNTKHDVDRDVLKADYIGLMVSEHEAGEEAQILPKTLESFYKEIITKGETDKFDAVLGQLAKFFNALHSERPTWRPVSQDPVNYDNLLTSARLYYNGSLSPLRMPGVGEQGEYEIQFIQPRDGYREVVDKHAEKEQVVIHLKRQGGEKDKSPGLLLLNWSSSDWRWKLWREGLTEGRTANLTLPKRVYEAPGHRIGGHLANFRDVFGAGENWQYFKDRYEKLLDALEKFLEVSIKNRDAALGNGEVELVGSCRVLQDALLPFDLYPRYLHGDLHPRNVLILETGRDIELKVIDLAHAIVSGDEAYPAPMAFDFAVMELDAKARMVLDAHFKDDLNAGPDPFVDNRLLTELNFEEKKSWGWCRAELHKCFEFPLERIREEPGTTGLPEGRFGFVGAWRHFCLNRLRRVRGMPLPDAQQQARIKESRWSPARSYAQALFLASIGFLKFLDPEQEQSKRRGLACIVGASHALDVLTDTESS